MGQADVAWLRSVGLTDEQVLSTVAITSLFNFMNRLADGLGVEIPAGREAAMSHWLSDVAKRTHEWLLALDAVAAS